MTIDELRKAFGLYNDLKKIAESLHALDEAHCTYGLTQRQEKRMEKLEADAEELAQRLGLHAYHQSDPRGCSLYLITDEMDSSTYDRGVPIVWR